MTPTTTGATAKPTRSRNADASRDALLKAAEGLFGERGFERTTVRDIGERAGVDQALIARYFGNKLNLYLATLSSDDRRVPSFSEPRAYVEWILGRVDRFGPGPVMQAAIRSDTSVEIRQLTSPHMQRRMVGPLTDLYARRGIPAPALHAETMVAALVGVLVIRAAGSLEGLRLVESSELVELLTAMVEGAAE